MCVQWTWVIPIYSCMKRINTLNGQRRGRKMEHRVKDIVRPQNKETHKISPVTSHFFPHTCVLLCSNVSCCRWVAPRVPKQWAYVRAAVGLWVPVGSEVAEALSRGSDEGSRKLVVGCFLSTWLCPSSSKPDSTPCCLLCLLLSSRSFPKKASWTRRHKSTGHFSVLTFFLSSFYLSWHQSWGNTASRGNYCVHTDGPWGRTGVEQGSSEIENHVGANLLCVSSTHLPQPLKCTGLLSSMTCNCSPLLHQDIKSPTCCYLNN